MAFVSAGYWDIAATLDAGADATPRTFGSRLVAVDGDHFTVVDPASAAWATTLGVLRELA
jgi:hypothetical protein